MKHAEILLKQFVMTFATLALYKARYLTAITFYRECETTWSYLGFFMFSV